MPLPRLRQWLHRQLESLTGQVIAFLLFVATAGVVVAVQFEVQSQSHCIAHWANVTTQRSTALTGATDRLASATLTLVQTQAQVLSDLNIPFNRAKYLADHVVFERAKSNYYEAATAYQAALKAHPVPPAPKYTCNL